MTDENSTLTTLGATPLPLVNGKFAVFRRRRSGARFEILHDTFEIAEAEAVRLLAASLAAGKSDPCFYVAEIRAFYRFSAPGQPDVTGLPK